MTESLIQKLKSFPADMGIDQILLHINDPMPTWVKGDYVTQDLIDKFGEMRIVICHRDYCRETKENAEIEHRLSSHDWAFPRWTLAHYQTGILRPSGSFWFRSLKSFEANPDEGFDPNTRNYVPFGTG